MVIRVMRHFKSILCAILQNRLKRFIHEPLWGFALTPAARGFASVASFQAPIGAFEAVRHGDCDHHRDRSISFASSLKAQCAAAAENWK